MSRLVTGLFRLLMGLPGANKALRHYQKTHNGGPIREWLRYDNFKALRQELTTEQGAALTAVLGEVDTDLLRAALHKNPGLTGRLFTQKKMGLLIEDLSEDKMGHVLRQIMASIPPESMKAAFFENDFSLFRTVARSGDSEALKAILFEDDYRVLRELLSRRGHEALKAVVFDGDENLFRMIAIAREGRPLATLLFANEGKILRDISAAEAPETLLPLLETLTAQLAGPGSAAPGHLFDRAASDETLAEELIAHSECLAALHDSKRWNACTALATTWKSLAPLFPPGDPTIVEGIERGLASITDKAHVRGRILDAVTEDDVVRLAHGTLRFPDRHALWTQVHEILLHEDYYFPCDRDDPHIIDGGTHMGMAAYYFKARFPRARITGFEPEEALRNFAVENMTRNSFADVEILPYALAGEVGEATFYRSDAWSMAGSLLERRQNLGDGTDEILVPCVVLSDYLNDPVHLLKLDIEGAEADVLSEAADKLCNVQFIFCEVHQGGGLGSDRLSRILQTLETANFEVQVGKSHNYQATSLNRPFTHFDGAVSLVLWAKNRAWTPGSE